MKRKVGNSIELVGEKNVCFKMTEKNLIFTSQ